MLKTDRTFQQVLQNAFLPLVVVPAADKLQANDLAVEARMVGMGVTVVESKAGELFVLASSNESQAVAFARGQLQESKTGRPWFLLLRDDSFQKESSDRSRENCSLTESGFVVGKHSVEVVAAFVPAQNNTALLHSRGYFVGDHL